MTIRTILFRGKRFLLNAVAFVRPMWLAAGQPLGAQPPGPNTVKYPYPGREKPDLWLLGGQSNMAGYGVVKQAHQPDPQIRFFASRQELGGGPRTHLRSILPPWKPAGTKPDPTKSTVRGTGPSLFFARHLPASMLIGRSALSAWPPAVPCRRSGTRTSATKGNKFGYGKMVEWIKQAGGYGNLKGMVWYQGESDAQESPSDSPHYEQNLAKFVDRLRRDTGNPELPVIVVQICRVVTNYSPGVPGKSTGGEELTDAFATYSRAWETVREAQRRFAAQRDHVYLVSAADLYPMTDPIHLDFEAFERARAPARRSGAVAGLQASGARHADRARIH